MKTCCSVYLELSLPCKKKLLMKLLLTIFAITIINTGCHSGKPQGNNPLFANNWILSELNGTPVQTSNTDKDASLKFSPDDMRVSGSGGCNRFNGSFTMKKEALTFGPLAATKMMCPDIAFEDAYFAALAKVKAFEVKDNALFLKEKNGSGTILAKFIAGK